METIHKLSSFFNHKFTTCYDLLARNQRDIKKNTMKQKIHEDICKGDEKIQEISDQLITEDVTCLKNRIMMFDSLKYWWNNR